MTYKLWLHPQKFCMPDIETGVRRPRRRLYSPSNSSTNLSAQNSHPLPSASATPTMPLAYSHGSSSSHLLRHHVTPASSSSSSIFEPPVPRSNKASSRILTTIRKPFGPTSSTRKRSEDISVRLPLPNVYVSSDAVTI
jgi:hypothetical protein